MGNFNFEIPDDLHEEFKIYSIRKKRDMRDILVELIKKGIENNGGVDDDTEKSY